MIRRLQLAHLCLIVAAAGLYAWLMSVLPPEDPWRVRISAALAVSAAVWGALLFIETLRSGDEENLNKRVVAAYRRLLNGVSTLVLSTAALSVVVLSLGVLAAGYGEIEFTSNADEDVSVFLSDPGREPERITSVPAGKRIAVRLPTGRRWVYFAPVKGNGASYRTARIDVLPIWRRRGPQTIIVPEVPKFVRN